MNINDFILIVAILTFLLAFYVWKAKRKNPLNISFSIFCVLVGTWIFLNFLWGIFPTSLLILTISYIIGPFIVTSMFIWVNFLFWKVLPKWLELFIWGAVIFDISLALFSLLPGDLLISNVKNRLEFSTGPLFLVFTFYFIILVVSFLIYFFYEYRHAPSNLKKSLNVIATGVVLTLVTVSAVSIVLPALGYIDLAILDAPSAIFFVVLSTYAILQMQLFDIRIVLTEIISYFLLIVIFVAMFLTQKEYGFVFRSVFLLMLIYGAYILVRNVKEEIKQRKQLQTLSTQLSHANEHLKELDKMKTEFVSLASHELLTPVSAIEGYLSMLLDEKLAKIEDPKAITYMDRVYKSAKRLARLVTDMLNVSRIEEGRLYVQKQDANLNELIKQVIDEIRFKAEEKKQTVIFDDGKSETRNQNDEKMTNDQNLNDEKNANELRDSSASPQNDTENQFMTYGDADKIKEVVINIIGNAIKYSKNPGTITVSIETSATSEVAQIWQKIENEIKNGPLDDQEAIKSAVDERLKRLIGDKQILVHVKDQGIGIPKEELPKLFKKFHRVGDYTTAESQGTGLGLYISRALVELNHGRIWADSEGHDHGSTFTFSLPELANKQAIIDLEAQVPKTKESLKPLARPTKEAEEL